MTAFGWKHECAHRDCPCARDGRHGGKPVQSVALGGRFCCRRSYVQAHYRHNPSGYRQRATTWNKNNPRRRAEIMAANYRKTERGRKDYYLRTIYGITIADYDDLVMAQCGLCAVCGQLETKVQRNRECRLSVHHDHETGRIIALLCARCNRGMGLLRDCPDLLIRAAALQKGG